MITHKGFDPFPQDELSYIMPLDSDDFLVGVNATTHFNAKAEIEDYFDRNPDCGSMLMNWLEVQPDKEDSQTAGWKLRLSNESLAERLRTGSVHTKRDEPKSVLNTAAVLSMNCHYSELSPEYRHCEPPMWVIHARESKVSYNTSKMQRFAGPQSKRAFEWAHVEEIVDDMDNS